MANDPQQPGAPDLRILFPTFFLEASYPDFIRERDALIQRVYAIRDEDEAGRRYSAQHYPHGYTSYQSRDRLFTDPVFGSLVGFIHDCADVFGRKQYWDLERYELVMTQLFCNINSKDSYHGDHVHPYSQISGVIYLQCAQGTSNIKFKDPRTARWMVPAPLSQTRAENTLVYSMPPEEGKLVMFPSWLEHGVELNRLDADRISMSYNFELRARG